jgi:hypothetical protein
MSNLMTHRRVASLALALPALLMTACVQYTIDTTLNADGSGARVEHLEVAEDDDMNVDPQHFRFLMGVAPEDGWTHIEETDSDGDIYHAFDRSSQVRDLSGWSDLTGSVKMEGSLRTTASTPIGYVKLGEVRFHNSVRVRRADDSDGPTAFTYRETFTWDRAVDALIEFIMADLEDSLIRRFPKLSPAERGQVVGFARARFWMAVQEGLLGDDADEDQLLREVVLETRDQSIKIIRVKHPGVTEELLERVLNERFVDSDERLEVFLEEKLPGLHIALTSEIIFRLTMPGTVTNSNAHERDGSTLVWEFSPADAFYTPIEIFAESVVGG